jgi:hypothetical protein
MKGWKVMSKSNTNVVQFILDAARAAGVVTTESPPPTTMPLSEDVRILRAQMGDLIDEKAHLAGKIFELSREKADEPLRQWLTTAEAALLVGRDPATVRLWCKREHLGVYDARKRCWKIDRASLRRYCIDRWGAARLPEALRQG